MPSVSAVTVTVPATTANLGPGFDCIGAALSLHNSFHFALPAETDRPLIIEASGLEADRVATDATNLAYQAFVQFYQHLGQTPPPLRLAITLAIPLARGLGSSATAIVAGLLGANGLAGSPLSPTDILDLAVALEGHPDNVVPALLGGCRLAASGANQTWTICDVPWHGTIAPVIAIPNFELSTAEARRVLPSSYSRADAIFNTAHLGLLIRGLATGNPKWLQTALQDRIHQPYRQTLIPGYEAVERGAIAAGAYGVVISGAGPTLLALAHVDQAIEVESAMAVAWADAGFSVQVRVLRLDDKGSQVEIAQD